MIPSWCETAMSAAALAPCGERTRDQERGVLQRSGAVVAADPVGFAACFYERLFRRQPELRLLLPPQDAALGMKFTDLLIRLLAQLEQPQALGQTLQELGRRHRGYGVRFVHYLAVGEALIETLAERNGAAFDAEARLAWARLVSWAVYRMRHAATERTAPLHPPPRRRSSSHTPRGSDGSGPGPALPTQSGSTASAANDRTVVEPALAGGSSHTPRGSDGSGPGPAPPTRSGSTASAANDRTV